MRFCLCSCHNYSHRTSSVDNLKPPNNWHDTHVVRAQVLRFSREDLRERHVQRIVVCVLIWQHGLNERLSGLCTLDTVIVASVRCKDAFLWCTRVSVDADRLGKEKNGTPVWYSSICRCGSQSITNIRIASEVSGKHRHTRMYLCAQRLQAQL